MNRQGVEELRKNKKNKGPKTKRSPVPRLRCGGWRWWLEVDFHGPVEDGVEVFEELGEE